MEPSSIGKALGWAVKAWKPVSAVFTRGGKIADAELSELRKELKDMLQKITSSSVEAQTSVRGSPNDPATQAAQLAAIRAATEVGQEFANLFDVASVSPKIPAALQQSRMRYREVVTEENNLYQTAPQERELQCAAIEMACSDFSNQLCNYALKTFGVGLGSKTGRQKGRGFPE